MRIHLFEGRNVRVMLLPAELTNNDDELCIINGCESRSSIYIEFPHMRKLNIETTPTLNSMRVWLLGRVGY